MIEALRKLVDDALAAEGITPAVLELVDLSIEYSPVIPFAGGRLQDAVAVRPWGFCSPETLPDLFEVQHPLTPAPVDRDVLKVMRARYLLARDAYFGPVVRQFFERAANAGRDGA